ncbi:MAG: hypothetical protein ACTSP1_19325, partial [Candidatus Freyarchaeota archaeon]
TSLLSENTFIMKKYFKDNELNKSKYPSRLENPAETVKNNLPQQWSLTERRQDLKFLDIWG